MSSSRTLVLQRPEPMALGWQDREIGVPRPTEVVLEVARAAICGTDLHVATWNEFASRRYRPPLALGHELVGRIVDMGDDVSDLATGARVTLETHLACGECAQCRASRGHTCLALRTFTGMDRGAFTERVAVPAQLVRTVPDAIPDRHACLLEPLGIAVRAVQLACQGVDRLLVSGAGPIGLLCVAVARDAGVGEVVARDPSPERRELAQSAGATRTADPLTCSTVDPVDAAIDASGSPAALASALDLILPGGTLVLAGLPADEVAVDLARHVVLGEVSIQGIYGRILDETWDRTRALAPGLANRLDAIVTHEFPLDRAIEAFEVALRGDAGKVEVVVTHPGGTI